MSGFLKKAHHGSAPLLIMQDYPKAQDKGKDSCICVKLKQISSKHKLLPYYLNIINSKFTHLCLDQGPQKAQHITQVLCGIHKIMK